MSGQAGTPWGSLPGQLAPQRRRVTWGTTDQAPATPPAPRRRSGAPDISGDVAPSPQPGQQPAAPFGDAPAFAAPSTVPAGAPATQPAVELADVFDDGPAVASTTDEEPTVTAFADLFEDEPAPAPQAPVVALADIFAAAPAPAGASGADTVSFDSLFGDEPAAAPTAQPAAPVAAFEELFGEEPTTPETVPVPAAPEQPATDFDALFGDDTDTPEVATSGVSAVPAVAFDELFGEQPTEQPAEPAVAFEELFGDEQAAADELAAAEEPAVLEAVTEEPAAQDAGAAGEYPFPAVPTFAMPAFAVAVTPPASERTPVADDQPAPEQDAEQTTTEEPADERLEGQLTAAATELDEPSLAEAEAETQAETEAEQAEPLVEDDTPVVVEEREQDEPAGADDQTGEVTQAAPAEDRPEATDGSHVPEQDAPEDVVEDEATQDEVTQDEAAAAPETDEDPAPADDDPQDDAPTSELEDEVAVEVPQPAAEVEAAQDDAPASEPEADLATSQPTAEQADVTAEGTASDFGDVFGDDDLSTPVYDAAHYQPLPAVQPDVPAAPRRGVDLASRRAALAEIAAQQSLIDYGTAYSDPNTLNYLYSFVERLLAFGNGGDPKLQSLVKGLVLTRDPELDADQRRSYEQFMLPKLATHGIQLRSAEEVKAVFDLAYDELIGIGPLGPLWRDDEVTEIKVMRWDRIIIERGGQLFATNLRFRDAEHAEMTARQLAAKIDDRALSPTNPMVTAQLPGARVQFIYRPLASSRLSVTIRKFRPMLSMNSLLVFGSLSDEMAAFLADAVRARATILVSGGTGSGKTTLINAMSEFIPDTEVVITIEDALELKLTNSFVESLITKEAASADDQVLFGQDELLKATLRMRPDRIIVGEIRDGKGASVMLQAANTGHDGTMTTIHANSPDLALARMSNLLRKAEPMPVDVARTEVTSAINVVVQIVKKRGRRYVSAISVVNPDDGTGAMTTPVFVGDFARDTDAPVFRQVASLRPDTEVAIKMTDAGLDPEVWELS